MSLRTPEVLKTYKENLSKLGLGLAHTIKCTMTTDLIKEVSDDDYIRLGINGTIVDSDELNKKVPCSRRANLGLVTDMELFNKLVAYCEDNNINWTEAFN